MLHYAHPANIVEYTHAAVAAKTSIRLALVKILRAIENNALKAAMTMSRVRMFSTR